MPYFILHRWLILDDMGKKQLPKKSGEFLFEIIMRRHELRWNMMTSNRPLEDWASWLARHRGCWLPRLAMHIFACYGGGGK